MMSVDDDGFKPLPHKGSMSHIQISSAMAWGSNIVLSTMYLSAHLPSRLLLFTGPKVEIPNDDLGIRIRPVEVSAAKLPPSILTHEFGSMPTDIQFKVSEDRTFEGHGVLRPLLPQLPLAHDTHKVRLETPRLPARRAARVPGAPSGLE